MIPKASEHWPVSRVRRQENRPACPSQCQPPTHKRQGLGKCPARSGDFRLIPPQPGLKEGLACFCISSGGRPALYSWLYLALGGLPNQPFRGKICHLQAFLGFPGGSDAKQSACNAGDPGLIPGSGRCPGEGNGNPLQYSGLEKPKDRGAWWATVYEVAKS